MRRKTTKKTRWLPKAEKEEIRKGVPPSGHAIVIRVLTSAGHRRLLRAKSRIAAVVGGRVSWTDAVMYAMELVSNDQ